MNVGLRMSRIVALLFLPLAALVVPTVIVAPLLPRELRTAWPIFAGVLTVAAFAFVGARTNRWTRSRAATALVTMASVGTTLVGFYALLLWALAWAWD